MKKIYINPGHSDKDPGAVGYETERKLNVKVAQYESEYLLANYADIQTKIGSNDSLSVVAAEANAWGADLFDSLHFNAGGGDGWEGLVYSQNRVELGKIYEKYVLAAGQNSRGVKLRPDLYVLKYTNMPAIVNEGAFVDNRKDIQDWNEDTELKALGIAYAKAAAEFLGLEKKKETYSFEQFVREVQAACGAAVDGIAGSETLRKTVTLSASKNRSHAAVKAVQKRLLALGYAQVGEADGIAGTKFTSAVSRYQQDNGCFADGELAEWGKTWQMLLGLA